MTADPRSTFGRDALLQAGLLIDTGVEGLYGRSAEFEDVVEALEVLVTRLGAKDGAERVRFSPAMPRAQLERSGYLKGFPHLAATLHCFCGDERAHRELLDRLEAGQDWTQAQAATDVALTPAACYPVYPMIAARGPLPAEGVILDVMSWCFRREPSLDPARAQTFRQRERVRIGDPDQVEAFRSLWMDRARRMGAQLGLACEIVVASDPFFGRSGRLMADNQRSQHLKFELTAPINPGRPPTACVSFNNHLTHFAHIWGIEGPGGGVAHSGCVGFGLERLTLALLSRHGLRPQDWPDAVRHTLWP